MKTPGLPVDVFFINLSGLQKLQLAGKCLKSKPHLGKDRKACNVLNIVFTFG